MSLESENSSLDCRVIAEDDFTKCTKKLASMREPVAKGKGRKQPKVARRTKYYLTSGRKVESPVGEELGRQEKALYSVSAAAIDKRYVEWFKGEQEKAKNRERSQSITKQDNYRSRLAKHKTERLHVPEVVHQPGKSLTEDIDPEYYSIVVGRPTKQKKDIRQYYKDVRNCFLTRLQTGFLHDEILQIDQQYIDETKKLYDIKTKYKTYIDSFEMFLRQDHSTSVELLKRAEAEAVASKGKELVLTELVTELNDLKSKLLVLEENWRKCKMFQKFLYRVSPVKWRNKHDKVFRKNKNIREVEQDTKIFERSRGPSLTSGDPLDVKVYHFKEDIFDSFPPALFFTSPSQLQDIFEELERTNLLGLIHCQHLTPPAQQAQKLLEEAERKFDLEQKAIEDEIEYLLEMIVAEEEVGEKYKQKTQEICYGMMKELCTNEEMLTVAALVEDVYEDAVAPVDGDVGLVEMVRSIELKHEALLLELDVAPTSVVVEATKAFYMEEDRVLDEAQGASRKVHQMEILLKRLNKSLKYPKRGQRSRRLLFRSEPPQEAMEKYEPPKVLTREEEEHRYFFEEHCRDPADCEVYRPLCG